MASSNQDEEEKKKGRAYPFREGGEEEEGTGFHSGKEDQLQTLNGPLFPLTPQGHVHLTAFMLLSASVGNITGQTHFLFQTEDTDQLIACTIS